MVPVAVVLVLTLLVGGCVLVVRWAMSWGATPAERARSMEVDGWLDRPRVVGIRMTRAITVAAPAPTVWPWLAQLGRGAGWYSYDRLDNGGRESARHLVSWIPDPELGDSSPIGYLRRLVPGAEIAWWFPGGRFAGALTRAVYCYRLRPVGDQTRLVMRVSAEATGWAARFALWGVLPVIDSIMACRQLSKLKAVIEAHGVRAAAPESLETGARDQFQLYHVIYASGEEAGVPSESVREIQSAARAAGVLRAPGEAHADLARQPGCTIDESPRPGRA